jgi:hypothetical protein
MRSPVGQLGSLPVLDRAEEESSFYTVLEQKILASYPTTAQSAEGFTLNTPGIGIADRRIIVTHWRKLLAVAKLGEIGLSGTTHSRHRHRHELAGSQVALVLWIGRSGPKITSRNRIVQQSPDVILDRWVVARRRTLRVIGAE